MADANSEPLSGQSRTPEDMQTMTAGQDPHATPRDGSVPAEASLLPERLGRYRVERVVGRGSFGTVYLASDDKLGRAVAIKVPHDTVQASTTEGPERAADEARILASLDHPGIVAVYDVGRCEDGRRYIVSRFIEGQSLRALVETGRPDPVRSAEIVATVAEALHFAHRAGLVHRDVKPANILIDPCGRPQLADFGLAVRDVDQWRRRGDVSGSPAYMAPEQIRGQTEHLDGRADIWSLGAVFYELLTGRRPFSGPTLPDLFDQIEHRDPRPPRMLDDAIPAELERIALKCLEKRPAQRYPTAADLAADLRNWLTQIGRCGSVAPAGDDVRPASPPRVRPAPPPRIALQGTFGLTGCSVSLTVLLVLFMTSVSVKFFWPRTRDYFYKGLQNLEGETDRPLQPEPWSVRLHPSDLPPPEEKMRNDISIYQTLGPVHSSDLPPPEPERFWTSPDSDKSH